MFTIPFLITSRIHIQEKKTLGCYLPPLPPVKQPYYPITMVQCLVLKGSCSRLAGCLGFAILFHMITLGSNAYQTVYHGKRMVFTMVNVLVFTLVSFLSVGESGVKRTTGAK